MCSVCYLQGVEKAGDFNLSVQACFCEGNDFVWSSAGVGTAQAL